MKYLLVLTLVIFNGCAFGRPSVGQGSAMFSIPFDSAQPNKQATQENELNEEMIKLEAEMVLQKKLQQIKEQE